MRPSRGFTLIELMIAMAVLAILTAVALPSYTAYVQRSRVPVALDALSAYSTRLEQRYQDTGSYTDGAGGCWGLASVGAAKDFTMSCSLGSGGQAFTATETGSGKMSGYTYTLDSSGVRKTTAHPNGTPSTNCWSTRGAVCDT
jgi:type IV pilus assembly protein PilE